MRFNNLRNCARVTGCDDVYPKQLKAEMGKGLQDIGNNAYCAFDRNRNEKVLTQKRPKPIWVRSRGTSTLKRLGRLGETKMKERLPKTAQG